MANHTIVSIKTTLLLALIFICTCLLSCSPGDNDFLWAVDDDNGEFLTNDLERAQEQMPFTIIVPGYLPENILDNRPSIIGTLKEDWPQNMLKVQLTYSHGVGTPMGFFIITECNYTCLPAGSNKQYYQIDGVEVMVADCLAAFYRSQPEDVYPCLSFGWTKNDVHFTGEAYNYNQNETIKIITSMIEQMQ